jgi:hypothetical protein
MKGVRCNTHGGGSEKTHKILALKINVKYNLRGLNVDARMNE